MEDREVVFIPLNTVSHPAALTPFVLLRKFNPETIAPKDHTHILRPTHKMCNRLSVHAFSRSCQLTSSESCLCPQAVKLVSRLIVLEA